MDLLNELDEVVDAWVEQALGPRKPVPAPYSAADLRAASTARTRQAIRLISRDIADLDLTATTSPDLRRLRLLRLIRRELLARLTARRSLACQALDAADRAV